MDNIGLQTNLFLKKKTMNIKISTRVKSLSLAIKTFAISMSEDMQHNKVDLRFSNEKDSTNAYIALQAIGVKCYHAGKNAPNGASVILYASDKNNFQLQTV